jgi:hypothetical protein
MQVLDGALLFLKSSSKTFMILGRNAKRMFWMLRCARLKPFLAILNATSHKDVLFPGSCPCLIQLMKWWRKMIVDILMMA